MSDATNERKLEHIEIIRTDRDTDRRRYYFDDVRLVHRALPEVALDQIDTSCTFLGKRLSFPLLISCMTGGDHESMRVVNRNLAQAAEATGVAMGVGSQRVQFKRPEATASFALREIAPTTVLLSNLGAVQLNLGFGLEECRAAVKTVGADALVLHLNPLQEAVQPEGDTNFASLSTRIADISAGLDVPVILKEVGAGMSPADAELALAAGVKILDVAGSGGTSWSRIEHHRDREGGTLGLLYQDWGIPTPISLRQLSPYRDRLTLIASGGIRSGLDMAKAVVLGASVCGLAAPFLQPALESAESVVKLIHRLHREYRTALFLLGAGSFEQIHGQEHLLLEGTP